MAVHDLFGAPVWSGSLNNSSISLGVEVTAGATPPQVTQLGAFAGNNATTDGAAAAIAITLYDVTASVQVATATITAGTAGDALRNQWFFKNIAPVTLTASHVYRLYVCPFAGLNKYLNSGFGTLTSKPQDLGGGLIASVGGSHYGADCGLPTSNDGSTYLAGNMQYRDVPAPSTGGQTGLSISSGSLSIGI